MTHIFLSMNLPMLIDKSSGIMAWDLPVLATPQQPDDPHSVSVSIIGIPNVGKSTLLNHLLESKVG